MNRNRLLSKALAVPLLAIPLLATAETSPFTGNISLASEYLYRGIAQTRGKPALQGGLEYAHSSGLYAGLWGSNISWISDGVPGASSSLEVDTYFGYRGELPAEVKYDIGYLRYNYPGTGKTIQGYQQLKQDTDELYAGITWKWLNLKYSYAVSPLFGWAKTSEGVTPDLDAGTRGSGYLEGNITYDFGGGWGAFGHVGWQKVKGFSDASYTDYKLGVSKDLGFATISLAGSTTNAKDSCDNPSLTNPYCFVKLDGNKYSAGKTRAVLSITKTF